MGTGQGSQKPGTTGGPLPAKTCSASVLANRYGRYTATACPCPNAGRSQLCSSTECGQEQQTDYDWSCLFQCGVVSRRRMRAWASLGGAIGCATGEKQRRQGNGGCAASAGL